MLDPLLLLSLDSPVKHGKIQSPVVSAEWDTGNLRQEYCESNWEESVHYLHSQVSLKMQQIAQCRAPGEPVMPN